MYMPHFYSFQFPWFIWFSVRLSTKYGKSRGKLFFHWLSFLRWISKVIIPVPRAGKEIDLSCLSSARCKVFPTTVLISSVDKGVEVWKMSLQGSVPACVMLTKSASPVRVKKGYCARLYTATDTIGWRIDTWSRRDITMNYSLHHLQCAFSHVSKCTIISLKNASLLIKDLSEKEALAKC